MIVRSGAGRAGPSQLVDHQSTQSGSSPPAAALHAGLARHRDDAFTLPSRSRAIFLPIWLDQRSRILRDAMVDVQIASRGIRNKRVLLSMRQIPREIFLERRFAEAAYEDGAVPIPKGQTLSQPYIVAKMLEAAAIAKSDRVLEIWAGSGYLAPSPPISAGRFARSSATRHWCSVPVRVFGISVAGMWICAMGTAPRDGRTGASST